MKKLISIVLITTILFVLALQVSAAAAITVKVNGQAITFPDAQPYINSDDRSMVPVRFVSQALGANVDWDGDTQTVTINMGKKITLKIGERRAFVDGIEKTFDTSAILKDDRTYVPLRFVSEALGAMVEWVAASSTVEITTASLINKVQETVSNTVKNNGALFYSSTGTPSADNCDCFLTKESRYGLFINNYDDGTLKSVKEVLKVFYPTSYQNVYLVVLQVIQTGNKQTGTYDGRSFGCNKFEDGASIIMGLEAK